MAKTTVVNVKTTADFDVFIGRPSHWGNPYVIGRDGNRETVIEKFALYVANQKSNLIIEARTALRGKKLGCYCAPKACHGDLWASWADSEPGSVKIGDRFV